MALVAQPHQQGYGSNALSLSQQQPWVSRGYLLAPVMELVGHLGEIYGAAFSPNGERIASAGYDQKIFIWNAVDACENMDTLPGFSATVMDVKWSSDSERLFVALVDKNLRYMDVDTGACVRKYTSHTKIVNSCSATRRGPILVVSGSDDGKVLVSILASSRAFQVHDSRYKQPVHSLDSNYPVTAVTFSDNADQVISGGLDNVIKVWDLRTKNVLYKLSGHRDTITGLALSPKGDHLLSNSMDCTAKIWDVRPYVVGERCVNNLMGHQHNAEKNLIRCDWSADGGRVTCGSSDNFVYVWETATRRIMYKLPGHRGCVNVAAFHPSLPILLSAGTDRTIYLGELDLELD